MKQETKSFISFGLAENGLVFSDETHPQYPLNYYNLINGDELRTNKNYSYYVYVYSGEAKLSIENGISAVLPKGAYFCTIGGFLLKGEFKAMLIEFVNKGNYGNSNFKAYTTIGGIVEDTGRLKYIDGCTDSILIHPVKKGDPCMNHLHFPKNITQTPHTHPSHRLGLVIKGSGMCVTPFGDLPLVEGTLFLIKEYNGNSKSKGIDGLEYADGTHKFNTYDSSMDVVAIHPDSDFGAEDENHPMINRTIVDGVSASKLNEIKTK